MILSALTVFENDPFHEMLSANTQIHKSAKFFIDIYLRNVCYLFILINKVLFFHEYQF